MSAGICQIIQDAKNAGLREQGYEPGRVYTVSTHLKRIAHIALFIIGILGVVGVFSGSTLIGGLAIGLGVGAAICILAQGGTNVSNILKKRKIELFTVGLVLAAIITVGAFGCSGVLSPQQVGWGLIAATLAAIPLAMTKNCYVNCCVKKSDEFRDDEKSSVQAFKEWTDPFFEDSPPELKELYNKFWELGEGLLGVNS